MFKLQKEKDEAKTNETKLKELMEQMQDQFNELRANLAQCDDIDNLNMVAAEVKKVTEIADHHVADLIQDCRSV